MGSTKHAKLTNMYGYAFPITGFLSFFLVIILGSPSNLFITLPVMFGPILLVLLSYVIVRYLPVTCSKPGCHGRMMVTRSRKSTFIVENRYKCQDCGSIYRSDTFWPESRGHGGGGGGGP
jgi:hypothetical protein